jgi:hypothetical protein
MSSPWNWLWPVDLRSDYLTYRDIARLTDTPVGTLYVWRQRGKLPQPDVDNFQPLWKPETIRKWMDAQGLPAG